jgi:molybdopterin molybdotransferase
MISVEEARARIVAALSPVAAETVALSDAFGRVLAADAVARRTQPPFAVSAMDGWAVRHADLAAIPARLAEIGAAPAGKAFPGQVGPGQAVRIFTGGPLPAGADTVVIQEDAAADGTRITINQPTKKGAYVRPTGLDFRAGDVGLRAGRRLHARDIALAAAMNLPWLVVRRRPRIAILATGDELVRPGEPIGPDQIVSSNALALAAVVRAAGGEPIDLGIAPDEPGALAGMAAAARGCDLLVTLGGASVGDADLVHKILGTQGRDIDFWRIAMRPGKPLMFGQVKLTDGAAVRLLGLPGNPVSALVCAMIFVNPAIAALLDLPIEDEPLIAARLGTALPANDRRQDYLRSQLQRDGDGWIATPFPVQDSSMLAPLAAADCLVLRAPHAPAAKAGDTVGVIRLDRGGF